uniref:Si687042f02 n=1 Tax=Arundo donax TaxID=35708 RepID=A0A0A9GX71_ARUDO
MLSREDTIKANINQGLLEINFLILERKLPENESYSGNLQFSGIREPCTSEIQPCQSTPAPPPTPPRTSFLSDCL